MPGIPDIVRRRSLYCAAALRMMSDRQSGGRRTQPDQPTGTSRAKHAVAIINGCLSIEFSRASILSKSRSGFLPGERIGRVLIGRLVIPTRKGGAWL